MMNNAMAWVDNVTVWSGLAAWFIAQTAKLVGNFVETKKVDPALFFALGGMPSSHSASVSAVATSVGLRVGFDSPIFAVALAFALIVMIDAQSVRRAAGEQARLVNQIVAELFKEHKLSQEKLAELLGHTLMEVMLGMLMGVLTAILFHAFWK